MFRVVWSDPALDELARLYVGLDLETQGRVAAGVDSLNRRLADDPLEWVNRGTRISGSRSPPSS